MKENIQTCEICGVTVEDCRSWHYCPLKQKPVCHKCHEACEHLRYFNGYMQKCTVNEPDNFKA